MAKYKLYYGSGKAELVEADKFADNSKNLEWIEFWKGTGAATKLVLRVKSSEVWKIELLPSD